MIEAEATIAFYKAAPLKANRLFECSLGHIAITGIGNLAACQAVTEYACLADAIVNFGVAGALRPGLAIGTTHMIAATGKHFSIPAFCNSHAHQFAAQTQPVIQLTQEGLHLISSDYPINHADLQQILGRNHDLVDMEGYGVAFAAQQAGLPCQIWKTVSDFASPSSPAEIRARLQELSQTIASHTQTLYFNDTGTGGGKRL